jgi:hypothetical protein
VDVSEFWAKGLEWQVEWPQAIEFASDLALRSGYHKVETPEIPNIDRVGLTKEDVYQFWLSPSGRYGLGIMYIGLLRDKGGKVDGNAKYMIFCGGGRVKRK